MPAKRMGEKMFYCVKCKKRVTLHEDDICVKTVKTRNRTVVMLKGYHSKCGVDCHKIVSNDDLDYYKDKYGKCYRNK